MAGRSPLLASGTKELMTRVLPLAKARHVLQAPEGEHFSGQSAQLALVCCVRCSLNLAG
jgi:hypothetical protein